MITIGEHEDIIYLDCWIYVKKLYNDTPTDIYESETSLANENYEFVKKDDDAYFKSYKLMPKCVKIIKNEYHNKMYLVDKTTDIETECLFIFSNMIISIKSHNNKPFSLYYGGSNVKYDDNIAIDSNNHGEIFFEDGLPTTAFDNLFYIINYSKDSIFYIECEVFTPQYNKICTSTRHFKVKCGDYTIHRYGHRDAKITKDNNETT